MSLFTPEGWVFAKLADVAHWSSGGTPSRANPKFFSGTIPWIKTGELGPQFIRSTEEYISEDAIAASSAKVFPKGAVALAMYGATIGKASILAVDASTNQACAVGIPDAGSSEFLYYFLLSQREAFVDAGKGGAQPNISQGIVKAWPILVPPLAEQARIVEKLEELLSELDAGVTELKAAQRKLAQYRQSLLKAAVEGDLTSDWRAARAPSVEHQETGADLLQRILTERRARWEARQLAKYTEQGRIPPSGWQAKYLEPVAPDTSVLPALPGGWIWASLEQVAEIQGGIQKQPSRAPKSNHHPFLRVANVSRGQLKLDEVHEIELFDGEFERLALLKGDVLIVEGNGSRSEIGRCAVWDGSIEGAVHQNHLIRARPLLVAGEFVETWLNSFRGIEYMTTLAATTSGLYTLSVGKISKIPVPLPPQGEQRELMAILKDATDSCAEQEASTEFVFKQTTAQRRNILKAAFAGQLVPQDPSDEPASALLERIRAERASRTGTAKPRGRKPRTTA